MQGSILSLPMKRPLCRFRSLAGACVLLGAVGCAATGDRYRADVYSASQVNQQQEATMIEILSVMPARVVVDNSEQKRRVRVGAATLGAIAGGLAGGLTGLGGWQTLGTTVAGGTVGAAGGSMVADEVLVDGVTLGYRYGSGGRILTSSQVGSPCEFKVGTALMVSTSQTETRVQPNAVCPEKK